MLRNVKNFQYTAKHQMHIHMYTIALLFFFAYIRSENIIFNHVYD